MFKPLKLFFMRAAHCTAFLYTLARGAHARYAINYTRQNHSLALLITQDVATYTSLLLWFISYSLFGPKTSWFFTSNIRYGFSYNTHIILYIHGLQPSVLYYHFINYIMFEEFRYVILLYYYYTHILNVFRIPAA